MQDTAPASSASSRPVAFAASGRRVGDYQLGQMIGAGGMGSVFLANQISLQRLVALKILREDYSSDPVYMERFFQEVRLLAKLEHPVIVQAIEAGVDRGTSFFAMEYVNGSDMKTELMIRKRIPEREVLSTALEIANAMSYAWNRFQLVHRDIKPANIMRTKTGTVKLLDLGISKQISGTVICGATLTSSGMMVGSPTYISPEQANGSRDVDFHADIYSLGISMYHLLAGQPPYLSPNPMEIVAMHFKSPVPDLKKAVPSVSAETSRLVTQMLAKSPQGRPGSWEELGKSLSRILAAQDAAGAGKTRKYKTISSAKQTDKQHSSLKKTGILTGLLFLLLLLLSAVVLLLVRKEKPQTTSAEAVPETPLETIRQDVIKPAVPAVPLSRGKLQKKRNEELEQLRRASLHWENQKEYDRALQVWKNYLPPPELEHDAEFQKKMEEDIRYLEQLQAKQKSGLL